MSHTRVLSYADLSPPFLPYPHQLKLRPGLCMMCSIYCPSFVPVYSVRGSRMECEEPSEIYRSCIGLFSSNVRLLRLLLRLLLHLLPLLLLFSDDSPNP